MDFMPGHAPIDPIEAKCEHFDAERRWVRVRDALCPGVWADAMRCCLSRCLAAVFEFLLGYNTGSLPSDFLILAAKCSRFASIGSIGAYPDTKSIATDPVNIVGPLETRSGAIGGPELFLDH